METFENPFSHAPKSDGINEPSDKRADNKQRKKRLNFKNMIKREGRKGWDWRLCVHSEPKKPTDRSWRIDKHTDSRSEWNAVRRRFVFVTPASERESRKTIGEGRMAKSRTRRSRISDDDHKRAEIFLLSYYCVRTHRLWIGLQWVV